MSDSNRPPGLFASLKRLLATALEIAQVRLELLRTELALEKERLFDSLLWAAAAFLFLGIGTLLLCGFILLLFWEGYRLAALGGMAALFLGGSTYLFHKAKTSLNRPGGLFEATLSELAQDQHELTRSGPHETR